MIPGVKANKLIAQFGLDFKQDLKTKVSIMENSKLKL